MFEAVILAGGQGTRLKSVTGELPKPMVEVNGVPFLYRLMKRLEIQGCNRIVLSLCYRADYIIERVQHDLPVSCPVEFAIEKTPLGTGGAIKLASKYITDAKFIVLNGDTYSDINYNNLFEVAVSSDLVISGVHVADVARYGTLELGLDNAVIAMHEKGKAGAGIINSGTYVITTSNICSFELDCFSFEQEYVQNFNGNFVAFVTDGYFIDIGIPEDYYKACQKLN